MRKQGRMGSAAALCIRHLKCCPASRRESSQGLLHSKSERLGGNVADLPSMKLKGENQLHSFVHWKSKVLRREAKQSGDWRLETRTNHGQRGDGESSLGKNGRTWEGLNAHEFGKELHKGLRGKGHLGKRPSGENREYIWSQFAESLTRNRRSTISFPTSFVSA